MKIDELKQWIYDDFMDSPGLYVLMPIAAIGAMYYLLTNNDIDAQGVQQIHNTIAEASGTHQNELIAKRDIILADEEISRREYNAFMDLHASHTNIEQQAETD